VSQVKVRNDRSLVRRYYLVAQYPYAQGLSFAGLFHLVAGYQQRLVYIDMLNERGLLIAVDKTGTEQEQGKKKEESENGNGGCLHALILISCSIP
jgi:hypothetical protein